jgi:Fe-S-cluster containining protein
MADEPGAALDADQQVCQKECNARCCRYLTVYLPAPRQKADFDELSWFLAHENTSVYVEGRRWHLEVRTPCRYLNENNLCTIYEHRPDVCREYSLDACEYPRRPAHTLHFDCKEEFDAWWERRRERERRRRARRSGKSTKRRR